MSITSLKREEIPTHLIKHILLNYASPVINLKKGFVRNPNTRIHKFVPLVGNENGYYVIASERNYSDVISIVAVYYIE